MNALEAVVFDLGGVLVDWNPRYLYRKLFDDDEQMEYFLSNVCNDSWNHMQDQGRSWEDAVGQAAAEYPDFSPLIEAYWLRWEEMLNGPISETVALLDELRDEPVKLLALSNWSAETFPIAQRLFKFLSWFDGIEISGEVGLAKPDPRFYEYFLDRYSLSAQAVAFIDDKPDNVSAALRLGMQAHRFVDAEGLRSFLIQHSLLNH